MRQLFLSLPLFYINFLHVKADTNDKTIKLYLIEEIKYSDNFDLISLTLCCILSLNFTGSCQIMPVAVCPDTLSCYHKSVT